MSTDSRLITFYSLLIAWLLAGCISEPPKTESETRVHADLARPATYRFAAIGDAELGPGASARMAKLEEVVSDLSAVEGLDFVILAGKMSVRPEDAATLTRTLAILPAKKYEVGSVTYTAVPREGIRVVVDPDGKAPPPSDGATVFASGRTIHVVFRGRDVPIEVPSLASTSRYLLVTIDPTFLTARELAPGNSAPVKERRESLRN